MKNKIKTLVTLFIGLILFIPNLSYAQIDLKNDEHIDSFSTYITVNKDNSVDVTESIDYSTGNQIRHGIYRDIYIYAASGKQMSLENMKVTDPNGTTYQFLAQSIGNYVRVRIGDPDTTYTGKKTYVLSYRALNAVGQFDNYDEIYWNTTGNDWNIPILKAQAWITLPEGAELKQSACYYGKEGSNTKCSEGVLDKSVSDHTYIFHSPGVLAADEGLTVAVGFSKGVVDPYAATNGISDLKTFFLRYLSWIVGIGIFVITFLISFIWWFRTGRDEKGTGVIIPEYDAPDGLTPLEVGIIANDKIDPRYLSAEIVYLATQGYLKINEIETDRALPLFGKKIDYELVELKDHSSGVKGFDQRLLTDLFVGTDGKVKLSELKSGFYNFFPTIFDSATKPLLDNGYYKKLGKLESIKKRAKRSGVSLIIFFVIYILTRVSFDLLFKLNNYYPPIIGIVLSLITFHVFRYLSPAKTKLGAETKEKILGLKQYLQIAEKDRLEFHNAPEKKPEVFEKLLPYAMVLGVSDIWAKEFEGIYTTQPSWYGSLNLATFNTVMFANSLSSFSSYANSTIAYSPSGRGGGGSGGGGFSGGGGGGGGGGGW